MKTCGKVAVFPARAVPLEVSGLLSRDVIEPVVVNGKYAPALALLGWSLIGPPALQTPWWSTYWPWSTGNTWNLEAPLSRWATRDTFETRENCQNALAEMRDENAAYLQSSIKAWQCVSADDPRLVN